MKKEVYLTILYDYYGELLNEREKECFTYYYFSNYSLQEIADLLNISRTAIANHIKKTEDTLLHYEKTLHLYEKEEALKQKIVLVKDETLKKEILSLLK